MAIRPEYLRVSREPVAGFSLPATVKDFIYMGALIKTSLDLKNGQEVKLSRLEADPALREGDAVHIWWEDEKAGSPSMTTPGRARSGRRRYAEARRNAPREKAAQPPALLAQAGPSPCG